MHQSLQQAIKRFTNIKLPLLITGIQGIPGYNAFFYFRKIFGDKVIGIVPPHIHDLQMAEVAQINSENLCELDKLFSQFHFGSAIDASGWCALKAAEYNYELATLVNVTIGCNLAKVAKTHGCRLIRLSTDLVFDGKIYTKDEKCVEGNYTEDWPVSPITVYGKTMAHAENEIRLINEHAAILRIALPMGPSLNGHAGAIDWIESRFIKNLPATLYYDEVRSSAYVQDINTILGHFLMNQAAGIYHLGGPKCLSLYEIAQVINKLGNYPPRLLQGCLRGEAGPVPPRAGNVSMDSTRISSWIPKGILKPWPCGEFQPDERDWHNQRERAFSADFIYTHLFGYDYPHRWDHPLNLIPLKGKYRETKLRLDTHNG